MRTIKQVSALILCLCLLIGLPLSVSAVGTEANTGRPSVLTVMAVPPNGSATNPDIAFTMYFTRDMNNMPDNLNFWVNVYAGDTLVGEKVAVTVAGRNQFYYDIDQALYQRCPAFEFTDTSQGFSWWKTNKNADRFEFCISETSTTTHNWAINDWTAASGGNPLNALQTIDDCDAVIMPILMQEDWLTFESATKISDTKILAKFSEPIAMAALNAAGGPVDIWVRVVDSTGAFYDTQQWQAMEASVRADNAQYMEISVPALAKAEQKLTELGDGYSLQLYFADVYDNLDCANRGESAYNSIVDGIWATETNCPLIVDKKGKSDYMYRDYDSEIPAAWDGDTFYSSLDEALSAATEGGKTVTLFEDATVDSVMMVPAGVTLNLNGQKVTAKHLMSFGDIIDSSEGEGGIVISKNGSEAGIHLQVDNTALPLYDTDLGGYRFFTYSVTSAGTKNATQDENTTNDNDLTWVKFGIKVQFDAQKAYDLLAADVNQDAALILDLNVGTNNFLIRFKQSTLQSLASEVAGNFAGRAGKVITLTVYGLDSLDEGTVLTATPTLYSAQEVSMSGGEMQYTTPVTESEVA